jgi:hypothetical protein
MVPVEWSCSQHEDSQIILSKPSQKRSQFMNRTTLTCLTGQGWSRGGSVSIMSLSIHRRWKVTYHGEQPGPEACLGYRYRPR